MPGVVLTPYRVAVMRPTQILLLALLSAALAPFAAADSRNAIEIRIDPAGFEAPKENIHAVCKSAGDQLLKHMIALDPASIVVSKDQNGPIVLFQRGENGAHQVKLDTGKTFWAQYAYQFAHEICHVLCRYEDDYKGNLWFEETLCELASLYCLREMARVWRKDPPYSNWTSFAPNLRDYTDEIVRKREGYLEILKIGLPAYYGRHAEHLKSHPTDREKTGAMAVALLALFEKDPAHWNAIRWLNSAPSPEGETFLQYLRKWRQAVPDKHREFVDAIAGMFGVELGEFVPSR